MPQAHQSKSMFRMEVSVTEEIDAPPAAVWAVLTDASRMAGWNSTIESVQGTIAEGERIELVSTSAPDRVFRLRVSDMRPEAGMVWSDGFAPMFKGVRTYVLSPTAAGTRFSMTEVFSGLMLPMIAGSLPDFGPVFEAWARDLKAEVESGESASG